MNKRNKIVSLSIFIGIIIIFMIGRGNSINNHEILEAAEKTIKSIVTSDMGEVPEVTSVIVYSDNNASIVKVAYMTESKYQGTFFCYVYGSSTVLRNRIKHSPTYNYDMTADELERTIAEWEME